MAIENVSLVVEGMSCNHLESPFSEGALSKKELVLLGLRVGRIIIKQYLKGLILREV